MSPDYYGIDFGGTLLRVCKVDPKTGTLIGKPVTMETKEFNSNDMIFSALDELVPEGALVGISAAGDIDEERLVIKLCPNSGIVGEITFGRDLAGSGRIVTMTNDMKAAVQAAARFGEGRGVLNVLVATYSTGYNCAVVRNGMNVTTAEFGHMVYMPNSDFTCGCGGKGHLESFVSGTGSAGFARAFFVRESDCGNYNVDHPIIQFALKDAVATNKKLPNTIKSKEGFELLCSYITSKHVYQSFRDFPDMEPQKNIQEVQSTAIADSFGKMNSAYNPIDIMVLMGGQTKSWEQLFVPAIKKFQEGIYQIPSLNRPQIVRTAMPEIGIVGGVAYFMAKRGE